MLDQDKMTMCFLSNGGKFTLWGKRCLSREAGQQAKVARKEKG